MNYLNGGFNSGGYSFLNQDQAQVNTQNYNPFLNLDFTSGLNQTLYNPYIMTATTQSTEDKIWLQYFGQSEIGFCKVCKLRQLHHRVGSMKSTETRFRYMMKKSASSTTQNMEDYLPICEACYLIKSGTSVSESAKKKLTEMINSYQTASSSAQLISRPRCMYIKSLCKTQCSNYASKNGNYPYLCNEHSKVADSEVAESEKVDMSGNLINPSKVNRFQWINMSEHCVPMDWEPTHTQELLIPS